MVGDDHVGGGDRSMPVKEERWQQQPWSIIGSLILGDTVMSNNTEKSKKRGDNKKIVLSIQQKEEQHVLKVIE